MPRQFWLFPKDDDQAPAVARDKRRICSVRATHPTDAPRASLFLDHDAIK
jgi:hypothetical protein